MGATVRGWKRARNVALLVVGVLAAAAMAWQIVSALVSASGRG